MAAEQNLGWAIVTTINVCFLDGDAPINKLIEGVAKEWQLYAGLIFNFVGDTVPAPSLVICITKRLRGGLDP
jgi:hypothetical protein